MPPPPLFLRHCYLFQFSYVYSNPLIGPFFCFPPFLCPIRPIPLFVLFVLFLFLSYLSYFLVCAVCPVILCLSFPATSLSANVTSVQASNHTTLLGLDGTEPMWHSRIREVGLTRTRRSPCLSLQQTHCQIQSTFD